MSYTYTNTKGIKYYLNSKAVELKNGQKNTIFYFSKDMRPETASELPSDRVAKETERTGLPVLSRKK